MRKEGKRGLAPYVIAAAVSAIAFIAAAGFLFVDLFFDGGDTVEIDVPSLVGLREDDALLDGIELEKRYVFSDGVDKGVIISQSHKGKVKVPAGEKYRLSISVSLGERTYSLPELRGLDIYEASGILREMGCIPRTVFSESDELPDRVLFTLPKANTELRAGDTVTLYVSARSAPKTVSVPDFYGCGLEELRERVEGAGLNLGKIEFIYSEDLLPNSVVYQSVGKNCLVKMGESIDFYISRLPEF